MNPKGRPQGGQSNEASATDSDRCEPDLNPRGDRASRRRKRRWPALIQLALAIGPRAVALASAYPAAALVITAGLLPPFVLAFTLWWAIDAREREPARWAIRAFTWGVVATFIAGTLNSGFAAWLAPHFPSVPPQQLASVFVAPVVEESLKACCVLFVFLVYPRQFDGVVDGIVYAALTGLGFELAENFFYHLQAFASGGLPRLEQVAFIRVVIFAAGHAMITTFTGVGVGLASLSRGRLRKWALVSTGLGLAITMHALHNFLLGIEAPRHPGLAIALSVGLAWSGNCVWLLVVGFAIRAETRWIRGELAAEVEQGTLRAEDAVAAGGVIARIRRNMRVYPLHSHHTRLARVELWRLNDLAARLAVAKHRLRASPEDPELRRLVTEYRTQCRRLTRRLDAGGANESASGRGPGEANPR
jgi:protease PrsW